MQDAGCGMQDAGYRMQDAGYRMQDAGYRMQDAGCSESAASRRTWIARRTSHVASPAFRVSNLASCILHLASCIPHPKSKIANLKSQITFSLVAYADLRICLPDVPGDFQFPFQTSGSGAASGLPQVRESKNGEASEQLRHATWRQRAGRRGRRRRAGAGPG